MVEVADTGPGLRPEDQRRVFETIFRRPGVGLGLAICNAIVAAHGGTIAARNQPAGGAAFVLSLPLKGPSYNAPPTAE
jgi:signal transduction histidine kinase